MPAVPGRIEKAIVGLRPSFSAHVRWGEHGAPVRFPPAFARTEELSVAAELSANSEFPRGHFSPYMNAAKSSRL
jgi:hypothetical protein